MSLRFTFLATLIASILLPDVAYARQITITNMCSATIWPAASAQIDGAALDTALTGFELTSGSTTTISFSSSLVAGRIWARTSCSSDSGSFKCLSGDCGTGLITCAGSSGQAPSTLAEFTLNANDYYDVSAVDGYNVPVKITPSSNTGARCESVSCSMDANTCPPELQAVDSNGNVLCYTLCSAVNDETMRSRYNVFQEIYDNKVYLNKVCCSCSESPTPYDSYCGSPINVDDPHVIGTTNYCQNNTWPLATTGTSYSQVFSNVCPESYSWPYDDTDATFQCTGVDYAVIFCPDGDEMSSDDGSGKAQTTITGALTFTSETPIAGSSTTFNYETDARFMAAVSSAGSNYATFVPFTAQAGAVATGTPTATATSGTATATATPGTATATTAPGTATATTAPGTATATTTPETASSSVENTATELTTSSTGALTGIDMPLVTPTGTSEPGTASATSATRPVAITITTITTTTITPTTSSASGVPPYASESVAVESTPIPSDSTADAVSATPLGGSVSTVYVYSTIQLSQSTSTSAHHCRAKRDC